MWVTSPTRSGSRWKTSRRRDELPTARRIVTVCRSGKRSGKVAAQLREHGYEADNIEDGMQAWHQADLPMEPPDGHVA